MRKIKLSDLRRAFNSLVGFVKSGGELVEQELAEERAAICAKCDFNDRKNRDPNGCSDCEKEEDYVHLRKLLSTTKDRQLTYCQICKCQLAIKVHIPLKIIDNRGLTYPDHCWQVNEIS